MRRVVEACNLRRTLLQGFLAPTTLEFSSNAVRFYSKRRSGRNRKLASPMVTSSAEGNTILDELDTIALSKSSRDPNIWAALLDPYLPEDLRHHQINLIKNVPIGKNTRDIRDVPLILEKVRERHPDSLDLLSCLGIQQKRWKAVLWLMKAILGVYIGRSGTLETSKNLQAPFWQGLETNVHYLSWDAIWADDIIRPLELTTIDHETLYQHSQPVDAVKASLGQVWQSIACMILQAADCPEGSSESKAIMCHVLQILAHMHHINAIPDSIYLYSQVNTHSMIQRPPTLNLFSTRITAILSDAARRAQDSETTSEPTSTSPKHAYQGHDSSSRDQQPQLHEVNESIWLDLVLWSCIESGLITEAARIATEIARRGTNTERSWSVIRWETLKAQEVSQPNLTVKTQQENAKSCMQQITRGLDLAYHGGESSLVNVPPRTVSHEVVLALLDGLANTARATNSNSNSVETVLRNIRTCQCLLATEGSGLEIHVLNCIIVRLVEDIGFDAMQKPRLLERILRLSLTHPEEIEAFTPQLSANSSVYNLVNANSAIWLTLLHHNLYLFATSEDIAGVLRTFHHLQCLMDDNRRKRIKDFVENVTDKDDWYDSAEETNLIYLSQIPIYVLSEFLSIVTKARLFELGKWLLYSDEVDGPTIPPESYSQPSLQPALLRFAAATKDTQLQRQTIEKLNKPFSWSVLRALLHCQISLGNWDSAEQIMLYRRDNKEPHEGGAWFPSDVTRIAKAILLMEKDSLDQDSPPSESIESAFALLQKLFAGEFNSSQISDDKLTIYQELRDLNQLFRMLSKCSGILSQLTSPYSKNVGAARSPTRISAHAFNHLVEGVVERDGSAAGKRLSELWCSEIRLAGSVPGRKSFFPEKVVQPNLQTLRIILRPIIEAKRDIPKAQEGEHEQPRPKKEDIIVKKRERARESQIVQWASQIFKKSFGLSRKEVRNEIQGEEANKARSLQQQLIQSYIHVQK
ncbi:hypothetical protein MMC29_004200 [Sticta canariensis]|nr:hypothetical protein [Sticta canariensis]